MDYKEFEKTVFEWLMKKNQEDRNFTFSVRKNPSKGSELDYFIGTEKSSYFGMTFWTIPVGFPGSASDLIDLFFMEDKGSYYFYLQFNQTKSPHDAQNSNALELIRNLKPIISNNYKDSFFESKSAKYERFSILWETSKSDSVDTLLTKLEKELIKIIDIVDKEIEKAKIKHPDFKAHRITVDEFNTMIAKMERRFEKYKKNGGNDSGGAGDTEEGITKTENIIYSNPNIILYGPPGTGKTYNTIELAYKIIKGHKPENHKIAQEFFKQERGNRIEFITFHQNYAYEDFVQGIRPKLFDEQLKFELKDGIFSKICYNAMFEYYAKHIMKKDKPVGKLEFEELYNLFIDYLREQGIKSIEFKSKEKKPLHIKSINEKRNIQITHGNNVKPYLVSKNRFKKLWEHYNGDIAKIKNINDDIRTVIGGCNATAYWTIFNELFKFKKDYDTNYDDEELIEDFSELDFKQKKELINSVGLNSISEHTKDFLVDKYVLIIDEINRANISRVFGELITLIEKDKRLGGNNEIRVSLPNGDEFVIPPNLYIVGTMNTADKSIALVDIALRRRFEFKKYYPDYDINNIHYKDKLKLLNKKIRELKGADFQIGHSYFMGDKFDLKYTMNNKVIPLLYEYFMNDTDSVKEVLKAGDFQYEDENTTDSGLIEFVDQSSETKEKASEKPEENESES